MGLRAVESRNASRPAMTPERWRRIDNLLGAALELDAPQRSHFLSEACGADHELRQHVETLLECHAQASSFIETPTTLAAKLRANDAAATQLQRGASLGRYIVLDRLGGGAMGVVYVAYDPELDRKPAIKLLRADASEKLPASQARARLLREAQAMARLSHPNVIAVYDVGTFRDQVFVAMEYVIGSTLTEWLAKQPRPWRDILSVFVQAGRGLAAAHAAGLLHRDF